MISQLLPCRGTGDWAKQRAIGTISFSLSHVKTMATAVVVIEE